MIYNNLADFQSLSLEVLILKTTSSAFLLLPLFPERYIAFAKIFPIYKVSSHTSSKFSKVANYILPHKTF